MPLVDLLRVPSAWRVSVGAVGSTQERGSSASLEAKARSSVDDRMNWLSALKEGAWSAIDTGWELAECEVRNLERLRRHNAWVKLASSFPLALFIRRPVAMSLLIVGLLCVGWRPIRCCRLRPCPM